MDMEQETAKFKGMLFAGLVFIVTGFIAFSELRYFAFGDTIDARVVRTYETTGRRGRSKVVVEYAFRDPSGQDRRESDTVSAGTARFSANTIKVQYLSGKPAWSRLDGNGNTIAVIIFLGSLAVLGFYGFRFWQEVREATRSPARSRR